MKIILIYWKGYIKETFSFDITTSKGDYACIYRSTSINTHKCSNGDTAVLITNRINYAEQSNK